MTASGSWPCGARRRGRSSRLPVADRAPRGVLDTADARLDPEELEAIGAGPGRSRDRERDLVAVLSGPLVDGQSQLPGLPIELGAVIDLHAPRAAGVAVAVHRQVDGL